MIGRVHLRVSAPEVYSNAFDAANSTGSAQFSFFVTNSQLLQHHPLGADERRRIASRRHLRNLSMPYFRVDAAVNVDFVQRLDVTRSPRNRHYQRYLHTSWPNHFHRPQKGGSSHFIDPPGFENKAPAFSAGARSVSSRFIHQTTVSAICLG
jgi:hypothetical protein